MDQVMGIGIFPGHIQSQVTQLTSRQRVRMGISSYTGELLQTKRLFLKARMPSEILRILFLRNN